MSHSALHQEHRQACASWDPVRRNSWFQTETQQTTLQCLSPHDQLQDCMHQLCYLMWKSSLIWLRTTDF